MLEFHLGGGSHVGGKLAFLCVTGVTVASKGKTAAFYIVTDLL